jgi:hypothetical protein
LFLEVRSLAGGRARHAADKVETPVQVDHRPAPSGLMQPVDVLGKEDLGLASGFESRQGAMRVVGQSLSEPPPADHAARPVAAACGFLGDESLHRCHRETTQRRSKIRQRQRLELERPRKNPLRERRYCELTQNVVSKIKARLLPDLVPSIQFDASDRKKRRTTAVLL